MRDVFLDQAKIFTAEPNITADLVLAAMAAATRDVGLSAGKGNGEIAAFFIEVGNQLMSRELGGAVEH